MTWWGPIYLTLLAILLGGSAIWLALIDLGLGRSVGPHWFRLGLIYAGVLGWAVMIGAGTMLVFAGVWPETWTFPDPNISLDGIRLEQKTPGKLVAVLNVVVCFFLWPRFARWARKRLTGRG